ncbi:MAG: 2-oxo acid dehydrogenase subunit E2 [Flavobacteriales bacterium]|jgi:2-oxoglutarate dehydrogenase E2 component (dihydrolipoamide succinyltransferase)|nr:2-oxo acid dehydrogenase subunit E2 [Flavobacteriales bacterium]MBT5615936.1 2-oxo acid dehydrogenase subunit E2 [Flavobacteriales bacterium]
MARVELIMPKMGESVSEATIITWSKNIGDMVELDETIVEIATDKVDSEVPSTHEGKLVEMLHEADDVVQVGEPFAILETEGSDDTPDVNDATPAPTVTKVVEEAVTKAVEATTTTITNTGERFYSPLVRSMASEEGIEMTELESIPGSGKEGRVTKSDMVSYLKTRGSAPATAPVKTETKKTTPAPKTAVPAHTPVNVPNTGGTEIVEMDRMRKLISAHMTMSKQTSAHITSFVEADMTNIVNWRNSVKADFKKREGQNITFTPIIIEAMAKAVKDFPMINVSVDGTNIHIHKNVNIGMAAALPDGNLIVPVIKETQNKNLIGITKSVNDLATRARGGQLKPDDIQGGTITMTNVGTFGNLMGTPIINQPQVAIMACGVIKKKPVVLETTEGDVIAIRHMMFLSLSYDHRVVDGALGGQFVSKVKDYLEQFDTTQEV